MTWTPPMIVQPTFGHPYCDRCGAVLVEEAKDRHVDWHRQLEEQPAVTLRPMGFMERLVGEVGAE